MHDVAAALAEQHDDEAEQRRYLGHKDVEKDRMVFGPGWMALDANGCVVARFEMRFDWGGIFFALSAVERGGT